MPVHIVHKFVRLHQLSNDILSIDIQISNVFNVRIVHFRNYFNSYRLICNYSVFFFRSFKCADSLTVHRRRLHLLPLLDKIDNEDDKQETNDKQDVTTFFFLNFQNSKISI